ncbi:hypothetical protein MMEU_1191 [Mycobacterium marinum str. Europe]|nr:hypothetical protein MMEU_1191 [Mycobacterium marinum str. Europe]
MPTFVRTPNMRDPHPALSLWSNGLLGLDIRPPRSFDPHLSSCLDSCDLDATGIKRE